MICEFDATKCDVHTLQLDTVLEPVMLLTIYKSAVQEEDDYGQMQTTEGYYIEQHPVLHVQQQYVVSAGQPLQMQHLRSLGKTLAYEEQLNLLRLDGSLGNRLLHYAPHPDKPEVWWLSRAGQRELRFSAGMDPLTDGSYQLPPMLFRAIGPELYCWFLDQPEDCSLRESYLQVCCLPNIDANGKVCIGSSRMPDLQKLKSVEQWIQHIEDGFWLSQFSHFNGAMEVAKGYSAASLLQQARQEPIRAEQLRYRKSEKKQRLTVSQILGFNT